METKIRKIGNSQGIILPANIRDAAGITGKVRIHSDGRKIIITAITDEPRKGWLEQFQAADSLNDHEMLLPDVFEDEVTDDWTW